MIRLMSALLMLACMAGNAFAEGEPITEAMKPILAAARIFALENNLHGDIAAADEDEGHIGESFEVNHAPGQTCTFTIRRRDGPIVESISFDRLSSEYHTWMQDGFVRLEVAGKPGAMCEYDGKSKTCSDSLNMLLQPRREVDLAVRSLSYLFSNVCKAAELPF